MDVSRFHVGDKDQVGPLLTRLRQESGLTSRQAAERAGVGQASLIQWETGHHCPNVASLNKMLRFYRVTVTMGWQS